MMSEIDFNLKTAVEGTVAEGSDLATLQANFNQDPLLFRDVLLENIQLLKKYQKELTELNEAEAFIKAGGLSNAELVTFMRSLKVYSKEHDEAHVLRVIRFEQADRKKNIQILKNKINNSSVIYNKPENVEKFLRSADALPKED